MKRRYKTNTKELIGLSEKLIGLGIFISVVGGLMVLLSTVFYLAVSSPSPDYFNVFRFEFNGIPIVFILQACGFILVFVGFIIKMIRR